MSELAAAVSDAFSVRGALNQADPAYAERLVQQQLAARVAEAIADRSVLVAEAGTGVGKTYAYLVPLLLSGARALVSTATKSLQDQLFLRDLPRLVRALGLPTRMALLKGRVAYLCPHRLDTARTAATLPDLASVRTLARIESWALATRTGDLAELDGLDERSPVIPLVTSTRENCLGVKCPRAAACPVMQARRQAMQADIVVINHHLFFADLMLRDTGVAELLPSVDAVVFDEAHQLPASGVQFLGTALGTSQLLDLSRDVLALGLRHARGLQPWNDLSGALELAVRDLRVAAAGALRGSARLRWSERAGQAVFREALQQVAEAATAAGTAAAAVAAAAPDLDKLAQRAHEQAQRAVRFLAEPGPTGVRWVELSVHQARLVEAPLDISAALAAQLEAARRAWVFTSATLGDDEQLSWFTRQAGLQAQPTCRVGSPFNYAEQARLYVPGRFMRPSDPGHPPAVAQLAATLARRLGGRTFVLTTTLRALQQIGDALTEALSDHGIQVLVQGQSPKRVLLERFTAGPPAVLVGSHSFWEGIDVRGDALQCVVIDKLPFPPPNDPLVEARAKRIEHAGGNPFNDYFVAEAAIALKQGAGRLIRSEVDRGLLVICDPRLQQMAYGRRLLAALPPMRRVASEAEALQWLEQLSSAEPCTAGAAAPGVPASAGEGDATGTGVQKNFHQDLPALP